MEIVTTPHEVARHPPDSPNLDIAVSDKDNRLWALWSVDLDQICSWVLDFLSDALGDREHPLTRTISQLRDSPPLDADEIELSVRMLGTEAHLELGRALARLIARAMLYAAEIQVPTRLPLKEQPDATGDAKAH